MSKPGSALYRLSLCLLLSVPAPLRRLFSRLVLHQGTYSMVGVFRALIQGKGRGKSKHLKCCENTTLSETEGYGLCHLTFIKHSLVFKTSWARRASALLSKGGTCTSRRRLVWMLWRFPSDLLNNSVPSRGTSSMVLSFQTL